MQFPFPHPIQDWMVILVRPSSSNTWATNLLQDKANNAGLHNLERRLSYLTSQVQQVIILPEQIPVPDFSASLSPGQTQQDMHKISLLENMDTTAISLLTSAEVSTPDVDSSSASQLHPEATIEHQVTFIIKADIPAVNSLPAATGPTELNDQDGFHLHGYRPHVAPDHTGVPGKDVHHQFGSKHPFNRRLGHHELHSLHHSSPPQLDVNRNALLLNQLRATPHLQQLDVARNLHVPPHTDILHEVPGRVSVNQQVRQVDFFSPEDPATLSQGTHHRDAIRDAHGRPGDIRLPQWRNDSRMSQAHQARVAGFSMHATKEFVSCSLHLQADAVPQAQPKVQQGSHIPLHVTIGVVHHRCVLLVTTLEAVMPPHKDCTGIIAHRTELLHVLKSIAVYGEVVHCLGSSVIPLLVNVGQDEHAYSIHHQILPLQIQADGQTKRISEVICTIMLTGTELKGPVLLLPSHTQEISKPGNSEPSQTKQPAGLLVHHNVRPHDWLPHVHRQDDQHCHVGTQGLPVQ